MMMMQHTVGQWVMGMAVLARAHCRPTATAIQEALCQWWEETSAVRCSRPQGHAAALLSAQQHFRLHRRQQQAPQIQAVSLMSPENDGPYSSLPIFSFADAPASFVSSLPVWCRAWPQTWSLCPHGYIYAPNVLPCCWLLVAAGVPASGPGVLVGASLTLPQGCTVVTPALNESFVQNAMLLGSLETVIAQDAQLQVVSQ
jgi:hypothetical protein